MTGVLTRWLYFRLLGVAALFATLALWVQLPGLFGSRGLWPAADTLRWLSEHGTPWRQPTLLWLSSSDAMLQALGAASVALSLLLIANVAPRLVLAALYAVWLSLGQVGGPFLQFQWDLLLLEALAWSIFYAPAGLRPGLGKVEAPAWARLIVFFIGFKVAFCSGVVKLASGDPAWRDLTALGYHLWTQPLPNPVSYLAAQWDGSTQRLLCLLVLVLELPLPLLAFGPRPARLVAAGALGTLHLGLMLSGNDSFFGLLCLALAVPLLDDAALRHLAPRRWKLPEPTLAPGGTPRTRRAGAVLAGFFIAASVFAFFGRTGQVRPPPPLSWAMAALAPLEVINSYGAFAVMTRTRPEIIVEGTRDGVEWKPYEFKVKPGRLERAPRQVAPWHPRLDWQLWFAAMAPCEQSPWFLSLSRHLLLGTPEVLALLGDNPFPEGPPARVRSLLYDYRFAPLGEKGRYWQRALTGPFCPELALDAQGKLLRAPP